MWPPCLALANTPVSTMAIISRHSGVPLQRPKRANLRLCVSARSMHFIISNESCRYPSVLGGSGSLQISQKSTVPRSEPSVSILSRTTSINPSAIESKSAVSTPWQPSRAETRRAIVIVSGEACLMPASQPRSLTALTTGKWAWSVKAPISFA